MTICNDLRQAVLQAAMQGKLTEQLPTDSSVDELLAAIAVEKEELIKQKKIKKEKPLAPISENEIPFDIPDNWRWVKLYEISFITKLAGFEYTNEIFPNLCNFGIPLFKGKNVQNGHTIYEFESYIPKEISDKLYRSQLRKPCLLTPYVGTIGNISIFNGNEPAHLGSNVGKIEPFNGEKENINLKYLLFYLLSPEGLRQLSKHKKKNAQESTSIEAIRDCIIALPPIEEQQRIVDKVEELMAKIDEMEKTEQALESIKSAFPGDMKAAILQAAMQGKLTEQLPTDSPVDIALLNSSKNKNIEELEFDIPETWLKGTIESFCENISTKKYQIKESEVLSIGKYPVVSQSQNDIIGFCDDDTKLYLTDSPVVVFGDHTTEIKLIDFNFIVGADGVKIFKPNAIVLASYLYYAMKYFTIDLSKKGGYSRHYKFIKDIAIPIPPIEEQQRIVEKLDKLLPLCDNLNTLTSL